MSLDFKHYKKLLEEELSKIESELSSIAVKNEPSGTSWDVTQSNISQDTADREEVADNIETYETNEGIVSILEVSKHQNKLALGRIELGTYGVCEVCGKAIEIERLDANPSAVTCIADIEKA